MNANFEKAVRATQSLIAAPSLDRAQSLTRFSSLVLFTSLLGLTACGAEAPTGGGADDPSSAMESDPLVARCDDAKMFAPGELTVPGQSVSRIVFTPDGKTAYFSIRRDAYPWEKMVVSRLVHGHWTTPLDLPFSGTYFDTDAFVSLDGHTLYFSSDRPVEAGGAIKDDFDIWSVRLSDRGYGTPVHLGAEINTPAFSELFPTVTRDGTLYFNSDRPGGIGAWDIYVARSCRAGFEAAENLGTGVNTVDWEYNPSLSADGNTILFASNRPSGQGSDLYASVRAHGNFVPAWNLGPLVNTPLDEYHPTLRQDQNRVYFVRQSVNPPGDSQFFVADARCLLSAH
jgi:hypothetical protein